MTKKQKPISGSGGSDKRVFYGPHPCEICGREIAKASSQNGIDASKEIYDYPEGPVYPNSIWNKHECGDLKDLIKTLRKRLEALESEVKSNKSTITIIEKIREVEKAQPKITPWSPNYPYWFNNQDGKYLCTGTSGTLSLQVNAGSDNVAYTTCGSPAAFDKANFEVMEELLGLK